MSDAYAIAVWWAMMLARDVDACCALLRGDPVEPSRLRPEWLSLAADHELVRFDFRAIDLLPRHAERPASMTAPEAAA